MSESRIIVCDLGWCVGRPLIDQDGLAEAFTIISPADTSQDRYAPAESVCVYTRDNIVKLRAFLLDHIHVVEPHNPSAPVTKGPEQVPA